MSFDPWETYNPFDEEDSAEDDYLDDGMYWGADPFGAWSDIMNEGKQYPWFVVAEVLEMADVAPSDKLIEQLKQMSIADIQRASALRTAGVLPKDIINETQLLVPGTPTQQLCQLAEFIDYADTRRD